LFFGLDKDKISDFNKIEGDAKAGIVKIDGRNNSAIQKQ
jgi:hypothetical protein